MARMIRAGKYNRKITLQRPITRLNDYGASLSDWQDFVTVHASIEPLQGREYFSGPFQLGENIIRVRIRYREGINRTMRVIDGNRTFEIYSVIDSQDAHRELQLMCKEGEAYGNR